ncbi:unnamed protein product [Closterium sp. NIES-64]|nr:unnamed protein product [Closterium sp. NIES-64]
MIIKTLDIFPVSLPLVQIAGGHCYLLGLTCANEPHGSLTAGQASAQFSAVVSVRPVVQIAGGHCYLLGFTCAKEPHGRSVWSIGCGLGGKLGHGTKYDECRPKEIAHFKTLEFAPTAVAAGAWHAAAVATDGRVATWGWGRHGCLGHGKDQSGAGFSKDDSHGSRRKLRPAVKACHVAAGDYTTFVVGEGGEVWSFGSAESACLGHGGGWEREEEEEGEEIDDVDLHDIVVSSVVAAAAPEAQPGCDAAQADVSELLIPLLLLPLLHSLSLTLPTSPTFSQLRQHRRRNRDVMQPRRVSLLEERATRFSYPSCSSLSLTLPTPPTFSQLRQHRRRNRDVMQPRRVSLLEERAAHPPAPLSTAPAAAPAAPAAPADAAGADAADDSAALASTANLIALPAAATPLAAATPTAAPRSDPTLLGGGPGSARAGVRGVFTMGGREDGRQGGWAAGRLGGREDGREGGLRGDWQAL